MYTDVHESHVGTQRAGDSCGSCGMLGLGLAYIHYIQMDSRASPRLMHDVRSKPMGSRQRRSHLPQDHYPSEARATISIIGHWQLLVGLAQIDKDEHERVNAS